MEFDIATIQHRQNLFFRTLRSRFLTKITKYQNLMIKNGVHIDDHSENNDTTPMHHSQSFEDEIELVLGKRSSSVQCKTFWKIGSRISTVKLFQWIYQIIARTKAARILDHFTDVPDSDVKVTIETVAKEMAMAYEYQLMVVKGDVEVVKVAQHAVACMLVYLNTRDARFTCHDLLQAVLEMKPTNHHRNKEILPTQSVIYDGQPVCLRWRLSQILKQPGLRVAMKTDVTIATNAVIATDTTQKQHDQDTDLTESDKTLSKTSKVTNQDMCLNNKVDNVEVIIDHKKVLCTIHNDQFQSYSDIKLQTTETEDSKILECYDQNIDKDNEMVRKQDDIISAICLNDVSSAILGVQKEGDLSQENYKIKQERRISAIDMDFENGSMHITEHNIEVAETIDSADNTETSTVTVGEVTDTDTECESLPVSPVVLKEFPIDTIQNILTKTCSEAVCDHNENDDNENSICLIKTVQTAEQRKPAFISELETCDTGIYKHYGCFTPFGAKCRPEIYGFRGPLHAYNHVEGRYTCIYNDMVTLKNYHSREIKTTLDDPHQSYRPQTACQHPGN